MEKLEVGKSYDAEELGKICGVDEEERYGHHAFVGEQASVIAQDEGNGIVKIVQIIRLTLQCPMCHKDIDTIYTSRTMQLVHIDGQWREEQTDHYCTYGCPECGEEFSPEELDQLDVPNDIR